MKEMYCDICGKLLLKAEKGSKFSKELRTRCSICDDRVLATYIQTIASSSCRDDSPIGKKMQKINEKLMKFVPGRFGDVF